MKEKGLSKTERVPKFESVPDDSDSVPENESFEGGTPVPNGGEDVGAEASDGSGSGKNAASPLDEGTKNPPRSEGGENGESDKGGETDTPQAEADAGDSSQPEEGGKSVVENKAQQEETKEKFVPDMSTPIPNFGAPPPMSPAQKERQAAYDESRRATKQAEQRRNLESLEPGASTKKTVLIKARRKITSEALAPIVNKLKRLIEKGGNVSEEEAKKFVSEVEKSVAAVVEKYGVADEKGVLKLKELRLAVKKLLDAANGKSGFDPVEAFNVLKPLIDWSVKLNKKRATPESSKNAEKIAKNVENSIWGRRDRRFVLPGSRNRDSKPVDSYGSKFW